VLQSSNNFGSSPIEYSVILIQRNWRDHYIKKLMNLDQKANLSTQTINKLCYNNLLNKILKTDKFNKIVNSLNNTLSLWEEFITEPGILISLILCSNRANKEFNDKFLC